MQTRSASCRSRVTNERDIRFVNGNNEPLYIYNLSEELSILFNYYYKVKSKIVINGKANLFMECYKNLGIILKEMYANKNFFKNKKKSWSEAFSMVGRGC